MTETMQLVLRGLKYVQELNSDIVLDASCCQPPHLHRNSREKGHFSQEYEGMRESRRISKYDERGCKEVREFVEDFMFTYLKRLFTMVGESPVYTTDGVIEELRQYKKAAETGLRTLKRVPKKERTPSHWNRIFLVQQENRYASRLCEGNYSLARQMEKKKRVLRRGSVNRKPLCGYDQAVGYLVNRTERFGSQTNGTDESIIVSSFGRSVETASPVVILSNNAKDFEPQSKALTRNAFDPNETTLEVVSSIPEGFHVSAFKITPHEAQKYFDSERFIDALKKRFYRRTGSQGVL